MTIEEAIEFLKKQEGKDILLNMKGIITTNVKIEKMQLKQEEHELIFENNSFKIGFNLKQLRKINKVLENEILLEFEQLQDVLITIGELSTFKCISNILT